MSRDRNATAEQIYERAWRTVNTSLIPAVEDRRQPTAMKPWAANAHSEKPSGLVCPSIFDGPLLSIMLNLLACAWGQSASGSQVGMKYLISHLVLPRIIQPLGSQIARRSCGSAGSSFSLRRLSPKGRLLHRWFGGAERSWLHPRLAGIYRPWMGQSRGGTRNRRSWPTR
jgi:hypothetical protein